MRQLNTFLLALCVSLLILVVGLFHGLKQHFPYAPQINAEQKSYGTLKGEEEPKKENNAVATHEKHGGDHSQQSENEGTEFWPPFLGVHLKITDSLVAFFTFGLFIFTGLLWGSTDNLWKAGERQLKLIQTEFVTTHRPRLIIRHVVLAPDATPTPEIIFSHGTLIAGGFSVVNVGGSAAHIIRARYRIYFSKTGLPFRSPLDRRAKTLFETETTIARGESKVASIEDDADFGSGDSSGLRDIRQFETEGWVAYVIGEIQYRDDGEAIHYMGFCRERQRGGRFRIVEDPDYEYQD